MSHRAKRLRVQLPCGPAGSLIQREGEMLGSPIADPAPQSSLCPPPPPPGCDAGSSKPPPEPPCGVPSHFFGEEPWLGIWDPDYLPLLKNNLQRRLKELEATQVLLSASLERAETHLRDVEAAEKALQEQGPEQ